MTGEPLAHAEVILRDAAGLGGLVGLGAVTLGAGRAWLPMVTWSAVTILVAARSDGWHLEAFTWMVQPAGSTVATLTAAGLAVAGSAAYGISGSRG